MELVRDVLLHKPFVQIAVYFIKEVICSAIEDDVDRIRSEKVRQIDDSVAFPVVRIFCIIPSITTYPATLGWTESC